MDKLLFIKLDNGSLYSVTDISGIENNSGKGKYTKEYISWVREVYKKYKEYFIPEYSFDDEPSYIMPSTPPSLGQQLVEVTTNTSKEMSNAISSCGKEPQKFIIEYSLILRSGKIVELTKNEYSKILILLQDYIL